MILQSDTTYSSRISCPSPKIKFLNPMNLKNTLRGTLCRLGCEEVLYRKVNNKFKKIHLSSSYIG